MPPSSSAELLLCPAQAGGVLWQSLCSGAAWKRQLFPCVGMAVGPTTAGNQLTSACCQQLCLLKNPLVDEISTLNVQDCCLKLSGLEGQG